MAAFSSLGPAWTIPLQFLGGQAAAGGIAAINAFGNIGGFLAPFVMGRLMLRPHGDSLVLAYLAGGDVRGRFIKTRSLNPARSSRTRATASNC